MAGAFGYAAAHQGASRGMAELSLAPAVRAAAPDTVVVADGTSCRQQIRDTTGRTARHVVRLLEEQLA
jgi:Fe-S oxidoreductase